VPASSTAASDHGKAGPADLRGPAEAEAPAVDADGMEAIPPMDEELRPARSFSVGDATFIVFTDGSIEARTPKGSQRFESMEEVRAYLQQAVS
jgi:hypothetical protein